jgi:hypothetical protein
MNHDSSKKALSKIATLPEADLDRAIGGGQGSQSDRLQESLAEQLATLRRRQRPARLRRA